MEYSNTNFKHKISVGFPVYNVENYVRKSLTSVLDQDLDDFEVLVVDDCGNDNSIKNVQELVNSHTKGNIIRILKHENNKGLAEARNTAIKNATGKYIYFIDSDDRITPDALSILYENAEKYQADVVIGSNYKQRGEEIWIDKGDVLPSWVFLKENEFSSYMYNNFKDVMPDTVWNILFSMDFLRKNHLLFPNIRFQEDIAFNALYQPCIQKLVLLPNLTYYYLIRENSLMNLQARKSINISEAKRSIELCTILKESCEKWKGQSIFGGVCAKAMKKCFFQVAGILKHRALFSSHISDREIRNAMKHPASLWSIIKSKQLRKYNLFFYILGILPSIISVIFIHYICKKKGYI